jgi:hypothetical protein
MDPEDRATAASASRPDRLEDARIDVLDRLVAEQKPLADGVRSRSRTAGMDREPEFAAAVLQRGSDRRSHELNAA